MHDVLKKLGEFGVIPVVKIMDAADAVALGRALITGDLPVAEITFRTAAAEEAIRKLTNELPELIVGAGTVLTVDQTKRAVKAGATFIVSPGFNPNVVDYCVENKIPVTPGVNTPSMIELALERGLEVLKFFPAEASGGLELLKSMAEPYGVVKFIPTGGINIGNLGDYLASNYVHACGGTWICKATLIGAGRFDEITRMTREAVSLVLGFSLTHLSFNESNDGSVLESAKILSDFFQFPDSSTGSTGDSGEVSKGPLAGEKGHICITTNNINRASAYLKRKGIRVHTTTAADGKLNTIYLDKDVAGLAIHLSQK